MTKDKKTGTIRQLKSAASPNGISVDSIINSVKRDIDNEIERQNEQMSVPALTRKILTSSILEYRAFFKLPQQFTENITVKEYILATLLANGTRTGSFADIEKIAKFMGEGFTSDNEDNGVLTNLITYMQELKEQRGA